MPATAHSQSTDWMNPHAGEVRKLSTLLEVSQALLAARELKAGLVRVLEILATITAPSEHRGVARRWTGDVAVEASAGAIDSGKPVRYRLGEGITAKPCRAYADGRASQPRATVLNRAATRPELARQGDLHLRADPPRRTDRRRPLHRSIYAGPFTNGHEIPGRGGLMIGAMSASAHRGGRLLVSENTSPGRAWSATASPTYGTSRDAGSTNTSRRSPD